MEAAITLTDSSMIHNSNNQRFSRHVTRVTHIGKSGSGGSKFGPGGPDPNCDCNSKCNCVTDGPGGGSGLVSGPEMPDRVNRLVSTDTAGRANVGPGASPYAGAK